MWALVLHAINAHLNKGSGHTRQYYTLRTATQCKWIMNTVGCSYQFTNYKLASHLLLHGDQMLMYTRKLCVKSCLREYLDCLNCEFLNREISAKAKGLPFGKICMLGNNPLALQ